MAETIKIKIDSAIEDKINGIRAQGHDFELYTDFVAGEGYVLIVEERKG